MEIRPFEPANGDAMREFSSRLPEEDRNFFKEDVLEPGVLERWISDERSRRLVAMERHAIIGYAGVLPLSGWSRHVAELRLIIDQAHRGRGAGKALARVALKEAWELGCTKIIVEIVARQEATIGMFQMLGFEPEALLRDHVRDRSGELQDLLLLAHHVDDNFQAMETLGFSESLRA